MSPEYEHRIREIRLALGIPDSYGVAPALPLQREATDLTWVRTHPDGRDLYLAAPAAEAWGRMHDAAHRDGVVLELVSAFRSVDYQHALIARKLAAGTLIETILRVNTAPGYSEHHTGRAIDVSTPGSPALEEEFEHTEAFRWMQRHASDFGFALSYPRNNPYGIVYEPWHWALVG